ncbi:MAG: aspartate 1-decarboxylase, partial [Oxalobacter sp.]|nr:aspartate 1-decarboxylase [Oxalobacter sp.]
LGDLVIIATFGLMDEEEAKTFRPKVVLVDEKNKITAVKN